LRICVWDRRAQAAGDHDEEAALWQHAFRVAMTLLAPGATLWASSTISPLRSFAR
jgi:hypothetical protein